MSSYSWQRRLMRSRKAGSSTGQASSPTFEGTVIGCPKSGTSMRTDTIRVGPGLSKRPSKRWYSSL